MFYKGDFGQLQGGAGAAAWNFGDAARIPSFPGNRQSPDDWRARLRYWADDVNLVPDLGQQLFSVQWFRGLATCAALCFTALKMTPDFQAMPAPVDAAPTAAIYDEMRSQMLTPIALGSDSGRHMGPTDTVMPLLSTPERPFITLSAAIGQGDSFNAALSRAGVSSGDIARVTGLFAMDVEPAKLKPGTRFSITLGRRADRNQPRPLDHLSFRARLDLALSIDRANGALQLKRTPIAVDATPLRIQGTVGDSIYRSARAAGASPRLVQSYLRAVSQFISVNNVGAGDRFDLVVAHRRAATGETETGELMFAGLTTSAGKKVELLKWEDDGKSSWFEASGVGKTTGALTSPVAAARMSSGFGMRFHPILGYSRMHSGMDFAASYGTPIYAVSDARVSFAGRHGGHGNFVKLDHGNGLGTGYAHMSRIATYAGARVRRGQVIGYVGSTGLSTGPHLHYEVYRNGRAINPASIKFAQTPKLTGSELAAFRARLAQIKALVPEGQQAPADKAKLADDALKAQAPGRIAAR